MAALAVFLATVLRIAGIVLIAVVAICWFPLAYDAFDTGRFTALEGSVLPSGVRVGEVFAVLVVAGLVVIGLGLAVRAPRRIRRAIVLLASAGVVVALAVGADVRPMLGAASVGALEPTLPGGCPAQVWTDPDTTRSGQAVTVYGECFPAGVAVIASVDGQRLTMSGTTDDSGDVAVVVVLQAQHQAWAVGQYTVTVSVTGGGPQATGVFGVIA